MAALALVSLAHALIVVPAVALANLFAAALARRSPQVRPAELLRAVS